VDALDADFAALREGLVRAGLLMPLGIPGVYGRSGLFEDIVRRFTALVTEAAAGQADATWYFPPVFAREHYTSTSHVHNFPDLLGSVHAFTGNDRDHAAMIGRFTAGEDWTRDLVPSPLMMVPAACYPLYPALAGTLPETGRTVELETPVFRHEPSPDPARMISFRQHELVHLGSPEGALAHRDGWLARARAIFESLRLPVEVVIANDPFFGRGGRLAKATQREQVLKWELLAPVASAAHPTAIGSSNYHLDYFGLTFGIRQAGGATAHTSCVGFGLERVALALLRTHGFDPAHWPDDVRTRMGWS
jgi:seryl-tRNA synthetase